MSRVHAVIPAAGRGDRFGSVQNKVFQSLNGKSIIQRTAEVLSRCCDSVTIVASQGDIDRFENLFARENVKIVQGSGTRQDSVWCGLKSIEEIGDIVVVHDGARPLVSSEVIHRTIESAKQYGTGVAAVPIVDAIKMADSDGPNEAVIAKDIDRDRLWAMQTPQSFELHLLTSAHLSAQRVGFYGVDEASLVQKFTESPVRLVLGDRRNLKITTVDDLLLAEQLFDSRTYPDLRFGIGYDIHRLILGRPLWLGGVLIPNELGLEGHSDADVLLHAVCDSLLGAAGKPDIGHFFPNTDPILRNISSIILLQRVHELLKADGWRVGNVDTMLIAEKPKIASYISEMKKTISKVLDVAIDRVSIKATTNEGIGSLGSGEGIACHASAAIFR